MATKRLFQLVAAREEQPGVAIANGTLVAAGNASVLISDPVMTYNRDTFSRNVNRTSLTPLTPLEGAVEATLTFRVELAGTTTANAVPDWGLLLEACGLKQQEIGFFPITGQTGNAFYSGETITGGSGDSAEVVHDVWSGATRFYYAGDADFDSGGIVTGATSAATAEITDEETVGDGWSWRPVTRPIISINLESLDSGTISAGDILVGASSGAVLQAVSAITDSGSNDFYVLDPGSFLTDGEVLNEPSGDAVATMDGASSMSLTDFPSLSMAVLEDGVIRPIKGCRGSVTFTANLGEPMFMEFEFKGLLSDPYDGALGAAVTNTAKVPPSFLGISYGVAKDSPAVTPANEHTPCINSWSLAYTNEISIERCASESDGTRGAAFASGRSVTGSFDPSVRPEASFPFLDAFRNGTTFRQRITLGDTAANQFHLSVPATQITSEGAGDRAGLATREFQFSASGKAESGADLENREFVLTYHQDNTLTRG